MTLPDFARMARTVIKNTLAISDGSQGPRQLLDQMHAELSAALRQVHTDALEIAAKVIETYASDIMDGSSGEWLASKVRALAKEGGE